MGLVKNVFRDFYIKTYIKIDVRAYTIIIIIVAYMRCILMCFAERA